MNYDGTVASDLRLLRHACEPNTLPFSRLLLSTMVDTESAQERLYELKRRRGASRFTKLNSLLALNERFLGIVFAVGSTTSDPWERGLERLWRQDGE